MRENEKSGALKSGTEIDPASWTGDVPSLKRFKFFVCWFGETSTAIGISLLASSLFSALSLGGQSLDSRLWAIMILSIFIIPVSAATKNLD